MYGPLHKLEILVFLNASGILEIMEICPGTTCLKYKIIEQQYKPRGVTDGKGQPQTAKDSPGHPSPSQPEPAQAIPARASPAHPSPTQKAQKLEYESVRKQKKSKKQNKLKTKLLRFDLLIDCWFLFVF